MASRLFSNFLYNIGTSTAVLLTEEYCFLCHDSSRSTSPEIGKGLCGSPFCVTDFSARGSMMGFSLTHGLFAFISDVE